MATAVAAKACRPTVGLSGHQRPTRTRINFPLFLCADHCDRLIAIRVTSIKVFGVTFTNHLSISEHISDVIRRCAQSLYAIKVLRCHGMNEEELRLVYKTVVLAKILHVMHHQLGGVLPQLLIGNEERHFCPSRCAARSLPGKRPCSDAAHC